jgi:hypothetical protein
MGYKCLFTDVGVTVFRRSDDSIAFKGVLDGQLYLVNFNDNQAELDTCLIAKTNMGWLWHRRLAHVGMKNLQKLLKGEHILGLSAFRPRGVPGPTSKLSPRVPAQMGRRETEHEGGRGDRQKGGNPRPSCCPAPRSGALAVGGYKRPRGRERGTCALARSPARPTFSYESPGPSFYRGKERTQVYNGGCSSVLTCLAERS